mmetsp:Transcript_514/g.763  ORF Transcript_514/g.763 Transcript_514/m.763 type:complete len:191 (-) Transcript_514:686-1258(-)
MRAGVTEPPGPSWSRRAFGGEGMPSKLRGDEEAEVKEVEVEVAEVEEVEEEVEVWRRWGWGSEKYLISLVRGVVLMGVVEPVIVVVVEVEVVVVVVIVVEVVVGVVAPLLVLMVLEVEEGLEVEETEVVEVLGVVEAAGDVNNLDLPLSLSLSLALLTSPVSPSLLRAPKASRASSTRRALALAARVCSR